MAEWVIDTAAEDETIDFIFTISHHPPRSSVWKPGDTEYIRERVISRFAAHGKERIPYQRAYACL
jgi:hypothetical protein